MSMHFRTGDICSSNCQYICHQVNCQGRMNSGVAKAIRDKWPIVQVKYGEWYASHAEYTNSAADSMLGRIQRVKVNDNQNVINMAAQAYFGYDGKRYTSYDAFWNCLGIIKQTIPAGSTIAFPCKIGCGLGGANWTIIKTMIEEALGNEYDVYIYELEK